MPVVGATYAYLRLRCIPSSRDRARHMPNHNRRTGSVVVRISTGANMPKQVPPVLIHSHDSSPRWWRLNKPERCAFRSEDRCPNDARS